MEFHQMWYARYIYVKLKIDVQINVQKSLGESNIINAYEQMYNTVT